MGMFAFDPLEVVNKWRGLSHFFTNLRQYRRENLRASFRFRWADLWFRSYDRYANAGSLTFHYFHQDLWAAEYLYRQSVRTHVDVGSRIDGFAAHVLPFCHLTYVDIRPLELSHDRFTFRRGSITEMPFDVGSVMSLSCLHVIEHVGLGRYGDPVDPEGFAKAAAELKRVLAPGGTLLLGTPVGRERVCFDAHRVFDPLTILEAFGGLTLAEFWLIDDLNRLHRGASIEQGRACDYGCGLFVFTKPNPETACD
jgi:SAM-dependent methyltransferase